MPWDNNNSGGGGGNNGGGPWGQAPGGGPRRGGGGNNTPSLEDLLKQGRNQLQGGLPGGRWLFVGGLLAVAALWVSQSVYTIAPEELGVELRFGVPKNQIETSGLHFLMWPIETLERVNVTQNQTNIASINNNRSGVDEGLMLSGDQNIVDVAFSVLWSVNDPAAYLFNVEAPAEMVRKTAESAMREVVGRRPASEVFRADKAAIQLEVTQITQAILDSYGVGVAVADIKIEQAAPPAEVADAFDEVQRAEQDEDRFQEEARKYSNTLLGQARGQSAQIREEAAAYKNQVVLQAEGEAARFISVYEEYAKAPVVTRKRLFLETMEDVLASSNKVIVEGGASGSGIVPYLPLNELRNTGSGAQ